jgi:hypothetical protein
MSEPPSGPAPYRVSYSERVRADLVNLAARARASGLGAPFLAAVEEIDQRLRIYPQFGEPLGDLDFPPAQVWIGVVPPLVVRYLLDEQRRLVMVANPFLPLPNAGF